MGDLDLQGQAFNPSCRIAAPIRYTDWESNEKHGEWNATNFRVVT